MPDYRTTLERIAAYPDGLLTPFEWKQVVEKMQDMASHALGWRAGKPPYPSQPHERVPSEP